MEIGEAVFLKPHDVADDRETRWARWKFVGRGEEEEFKEEGEGERDDSEEDDCDDLHCCFKIKAEEGDRVNIFVIFL